MEVGIAGKNGLLVPVNTEASGPPAGVVPWRGSMASRPVHSHRRLTCRVVRLRRVIKVKSWAVRWINCGLAVRRAVTGQTVACRALTGWAVACRAVPGRAVNCGWAVTCGRAVNCGRSVNCGRAVTCRAVHHLRWTRHWSRTINLKLPGRRRDHSDSSLLDDLGRQWLGHWQAEQTADIR